jgi:uncharacterized RmlC-like cupin family protein
MPKYLALLFAVVALAGMLAGVPRSVVEASTPTAADASAITKEMLGQGASAVAPDRILLLQRRTFAPGSDSGVHPAPGPAVLYVESGEVAFNVAKGAALLTRAGSTTPEAVAAGSGVTMAQGDAIFYDEGVEHQLVNGSADPAVTLEARLNPAEA